MKKVICWDMPCKKEVPICCFDYEEFKNCAEGCDQLECRRKMVGEDEEENEN